LPLGANNCWQKKSHLHFHSHPNAQQVRKEREKKRGKKTDK
jgi:hypothetical protein